MKRLLFLFSLLLSTQGFAQQGNTYIFSGSGELIGGTHIRTTPGKPITLVDSVTGNHFELDSAHVMVRAFNNKKGTIWLTDPWFDNNLPEYRTKRPVIVNFRLTKTTRDDQFGDKKISKDETIILITYNNTQFGFLRASTGSFFFEGQD